MVHEIKKTSDSGEPHPEYTRAGVVCEAYLRAIYKLKLRKALIRSADLAREMNYSKASISRAVSRLCAADLLCVDSEGFLGLTAEGEYFAKRAYAKYCFFKNILIAAGVAPEQAEDEACRIEHVVSDNVFLLLRNLYGSCCGMSPHGGIDTV